MPSLRILRLCCLLVLLGPASLPAVAGVLVADILAAVATDRYVADVEALVGLGSRYYSAPGNAQATDHVRAAFADAGLSTQDHRFDYGGYALYNIEATLPGVLRPDDIFIIGAHFDSIANRTPGNPSATNAPGANDNASGTAGVLEIARVLARYEFESTIRFIGFNAEERGMIGSAAYAQDALAVGERILGMITLDMIGNSYAGNDLAVIGDDWIVDLLVANTRAFTNVPVRGWHEPPLWSDHEAFSALNYPGSASAMAIGDQLWELDPHYHTIGDTADRLDYDFAVGVTRGAAATMIALAGLYEPVPAPGGWLLLLPGLLILWYRTRRHA